MTMITIIIVMSCFPDMRETGDVLQLCMRTAAVGVQELVLMLQSVNILAQKENINIYSAQAELLV